MSNPVFNIIPTGINYGASYISLSGTLNGSTNVIPAFYHYLANGTKESVSLMAAGTYSFEIVRDSRWNYDGSYLTVIGSISYLDGTQKSLVGRLNTYMGGIIFSEGPFDFSINDFVTNSFDSFLKVGVFAPSNNVDIGKKFSFTINPITPTYSITSISSSVDEGSNATFLINTNSVAWGSILNYTISGVSDSDLSNRSLSGTVTVSQNGAGGAATVSIPIAADNRTEGTETLTISLQGKTASTVINDTSKSAETNAIYSDYTKHYYQAFTNNVSWSSALSLASAQTYRGLQGYLVTITSKTEDDFVSNNIVKPSGITGYSFSSGYKSFWIGASDENSEGKWVWMAGPESGQTVYQYGGANNNQYANFYLPVYSSGSADADYLYGNVPVDNASIFPGNINRTFWDDLWNNPIMSGQSGNGYVVEFGGLPATYNLAPNSSSVNEGSEITFTLNTTNVEWGTFINYTISGISTADISGGSLSGSAVVNSSGVATIAVTLLNDALTEGTEILTVTAGGATAFAQIIDTPQPTPLNLTVYLSPSQNFNLSYGNVSIYGNANNEIVNFADNISAVTTDSSIESITFPYSIEDYQFQAVSGQLYTYRNSVLISKAAIQPDSDGTTIGFNNGFGTYTSASNLIGPYNAVALISGSQIKIGNSIVSSSAPANLNYSPKPTYVVFANSAFVDEGLSASFNLTTTNIAPGSTLSYTLEGVSSEDIVGGAISGTLTLNANGFAVIQIPIANDFKTEGTETLTIRIAEAIARTFINDTSVTPNTIVASIPYGNGQFYFATLGADKVTGTNFVDVVKESSVLSANQLSKNSDGSWLVQNKLSPSNSDTLVNVERIEFNDMSVALDVSGPAGQVAKILGSVFGPSSVNNTEYAGIGFAYLDAGMSYLDLCSLAADAAGLSTPELLVTALLRNATGFEPTALSKAPYLQSISSGASFGSVVQQIADSSVNAQTIKLADIANAGLAYKPYVLPATYSLSPASTSVNEGSNAVFNLRTSNVSVGTEVSYSLSGVSPSDTLAGLLSGKVTVGAGGLATISIPISADGATEGQETLTINAQGATASVVINDTSPGIALPTYSLTPASLSINEGELARVYVNTTSVAAGTVLQYALSGISPSDLIGGLTRQVTVDSLGQALINLQTVADFETEGPETIYITLGTSVTSITINDTSVTLVGVIDSGGGDGGGGGGGD